MTSNKPAFLVLEDGTVHKGLSFGYTGTAGGEVVFNTSFCGYQEILTDPSYSGQIVVMTTPHIGNYGVNESDIESDKVYLEGFVALSFSESYSNYRATKSLREYLIEHKVVAACDIDTRSITKKLRIKGAMNGVLTSETSKLEEILAKAKSLPSMSGLDLASIVSGSRTRKTKGRRQLCLIDCGYKENILREFRELGIDGDVVPISEAGNINISDYKIFCISNGPGDPVPVEPVADFVRELAANPKPLLGICLGHQIIAHALGARITKLRFGHHGSNHPVRDEETGQVYITSQNHGFSVDEESAVKAGFRVKFRNLYDNSVEGLVHTKFPFYCIQFHPEAAPGPQETRHIFREFAAKTARIATKGRRVKDEATTA